MRTHRLDWAFALILLGLALLLVGGFLGSTAVLVLALAVILAGFWGAMI